MVMPYLGAPAVPGTERVEKPAASKVDTVSGRNVFVECTDAEAIIVLPGSTIVLSPGETQHLAQWLTQAAAYLRSKS